MGLMWCYMCDVAWCDVMWSYGSLTRSQLLEKAYAKLYGSYHGLDGGTMIHALRDLTGAACEDIELDDQLIDHELLWLQLSSCHNASFLMAACCGSNLITKDVFAKMGLNDNHAYNLVTEYSPSLEFLITCVFFHWVQIYFVGFTNLGEWCSLGQAKKSV